MGDWNEDEYNIFIPYLETRLIIVERYLPM